MKFVVYLNGVRATKNDMEAFLRDNKAGKVIVSKIEMTASGAISISYD